MSFEFPSLGEPLPIELANTRYVDGDEVVDFLAPPGAITAWLHEHGSSVGLGAPDRPFAAAEEAELSALRDSVRGLIEAVVDGEVPDTADVDLLNRRVRDGRPVPARLAWSADGATFVAEPGTQVLDAATVAARLAAATVDLLTGPDAVRLRRCAAPDCRMLFVRHHHRRRWCHESCGHRLRQARYYRRRTQGAP